MTVVRKAAIVGGSLAGLLVANLLHRYGWHVDVFERVAEPLEGRGAGIVTHPELMEVLERAGVPAGDSLGVRVEERVTLARDGSVLDRRAHPQILTSWGRLYSRLKEALPAQHYHSGRQFATVEQDECGVTAQFTDGSEVRADILIGADGIRSRVRQIVLPNVDPEYAGYIAWRGLIEGADLSSRVREDVLPYFSFGLPPREQMVAYPVAGQEGATLPGGRRLNFVWYRPAEESTTLRQMLTDASGRIWAEGIPPPHIRSEVREQAKRAAREVLAPQFAEVIERTPALFFQPIVDLESPRLAFGRVALVGDAAFVARPHCGMGITKAAGDARELADALQADQDCERALRAYEQPRLAFGHFIVGHARALGAYMQAQLKTERERQMAERYRTPEAVMRETAVAPTHA